MSVDRLTVIVQRFCKEAIRWKALNHPNVLPLLGVSMEERRFVMVSEWMENGNINEFIRSHTDVDLFELVSLHSCPPVAPFTDGLPNSSKTSPGDWYTCTIRGWCTVT